MVEGGRKGGAYSLWSSRLISILQLKANKLKEQICTLELEVQTLSKAYTDNEQICTWELEVQTLSQSNTDSNIISTYK